MTDKTNKPAGKYDDDGQLISLATKAEAKKPDAVRDGAWRRARIAAGHMVLIRSHFKSIFLIPLAIVSLVCGIAVTMVGDGADAENWRHAWGLIWIFTFMFYMNIFIFEWNRAWTIVLLGGMVTTVAILFAINSDSFPVFTNIWDGVKALRLDLSPQVYMFFFLFFSFCAFVSWVKTRLNYVVIEHNEMQIYRNAFFGDRERISMLNPRIEVKVQDMVEYFHPFYRAGTVIIHAPTKTIILDNVLSIRKIERITDRLGSTLSVRIETDSSAN
ncbi:MAG: putative MAPEG superfamily protein [Planctomycetota bacterium]